MYTQKARWLETALFDMDGTIIKTLHIWDAIVASMVGEKKIERFRALRDAQEGTGMEKTCHTLRRHFGYVQNDEYLIDLYKHNARQVIASHPIEFIPGFLEFHAFLKKQHVETCLVTNAPSYALDPLIQKMGFDQLFGEHIYNSCRVGSIFKPDPAIVKCALQKLKPNLTSTVIFEDTLKGVQSARGAGIKYVVAIGSQTLDNDLDKVDQESHPNLIIDNYLRKEVLMMNLQKIMQK